MNKNINELNNRCDEFVVKLLAFSASQTPKYYKIGKHGKIEKMTSDDYANIDKFPKGTIFYYQYPEDGIKLDI